MGLESKMTDRINFNIQDVVAEKLCVGCGACAAASDQQRIHRNEFGIMQAALSVGDPAVLAVTSAVCPFSDDALNEDDLAKVFLDEGLAHDPRTGRYLSIHSGRLKDTEALMGSSSGGLTSWLCLQLLRDGLVDGVIHIGEGSDHTTELFQFRISRTESELLSRRKSQYYSASFDQALAEIKGDSKKYVFVGVPCFVKAIRNLCVHDAGLRQQIPFTVGLVCGHMKSSAFAELLAWQVGVAPAQISKVDFRKKDPSKQVGQYKFAALSKDGVTREQTSIQLSGGNWGHATFQLQACDYCDDVFAETADVVFGDAWLPKFQYTWQGTNVVLVRDERLARILNRGKESGEIYLDPLSIDDLVFSQGGNFRHRWDGLSVRLLDDQAAGRPRPKKRIAAGSRTVDQRREKIVRLRQQMAAASHQAFQAAKSSASLDLYFLKINPLAKEMARLSRPTGYRRALAKIRRALDGLIRRVG